MVTLYDKYLINSSCFIDYDMVEYIKRMENCIIYKNGRQGQSREENIVQRFAIYGDIIYTPEPDVLKICENGYVVNIDGVCAGVFERLPEEYSDIKIYDYERKLVIPGFSDLHLHASQYRNMGLGMDLELLRWLNDFAFPEEARFAYREYAEKVYHDFSNELKRSATARACIFATLHIDATEILMQELEKTGLKTFVGLVGMDQEKPDYLCEKKAEDGIEAAETWLFEIAGKFKNTAPIITPRFVPSCTPRLMEGLGALADVYGIPIQSHLSENLDEIKLVSKLHPECKNYADVYDTYGLLNDRTVMAHCIYLKDEEIELMRTRGAFIAHCPTSNTNVRSGIAPIRRYMNEGLKIGLGSDISGGQTTDMFAVMREAIGVSKLLWRAGKEKYPYLKTTDAFYLASKGGGEFFGKCGSFEDGYEFDALVIDDKSYGGDAEQDIRRRFEKMVYMAGVCDIKAKFVAGKRIF